MTLLCLLLAGTAFALLGLATDAHHRRHLRGPLRPLRQRRMRAAAWGALALAFVAAIGARGWVFGPVLWVAATMLAAAATFLALNLLPLRTKLFGRQK